MIDLVDLTIQFGSAPPVVRGLSLRLGVGEVLGLVGESGSGKSLTGLALMGLLPSEASVQGSVVIDDKTLDISTLQYPNHNKWPLRRAIVFQDAGTALNPVMTCGAQVLEAVQAHQQLSKSEAKKVVFSRFAQVELSEAERIYRSYPHQISGGQQQRVVLAMALATRPQFLIADEPTTALDPDLRQGLVRTLLRLRDETGLSILFISHDLKLVGQMADKVAIVREGSLVEYGPVESVLQKPVHPYTKGLLACQPSSELVYERLPTVQAFLENNDFQPVVLNQEKLAKRRTDIYTKNPLLEVRHPGVRYSTPGAGFWQRQRWTEALQPTAFNLYPGEVLGITGPSGSGKSTLGRALLSLPLNTADAHNNTPKTIRIAQNPYATLQPRMRIGNAIAEPLWVHRLYPNYKACQERSLELMDMVGLSADLFNRLPHALSGGQRQRVSIARALALQPRLLICDEITSALDVSVQATVLNLLLDLRDQLGLTYVFISHDLDVVHQMCDRVLKMRDGAIQ
jgi:peptide/nickel transport system ATP-binding protein